MTSPKREIRRSDEQYAPIASAYTTSRIHAQGADLARIVELAALPQGAVLLDVGTGAGHTGLAFSRSGVEVVGLDLTQAMLVQARRLAEEQQTTFNAVRGLAEALPFGDTAFDGVSCRYCAHHFLDVPGAIREMHRVLQPGGVLIFVDIIAPEDDEADDFVNYLEWLRDPSHRREARLSEYERWFDAAGLQIDHIETFPETIVVDQWFARAQTAPEREQEARGMLASASPKLHELFAITSDPVAFDLGMVLIKATAT